MTHRESTSSTGVEEVAYWPLGAPDDGCGAEPHSAGSLPHVPLLRSPTTGEPYSPLVAKLPRRGQTKFSGDCPQWRSCFDEVTTVSKAAAGTQERTQPGTDTGRE